MPVGRDARVRANGTHTTTWPAYLHPIVKLYHYTSAVGAESILAHAITEGHFNFPNGEVLHKVVWLTTDPKVWGHGLPDGTTRLSDEQRSYLTRVSGRPVTNNFTKDHTAVRLTVNVPDDHPGLISFRAYCQKVATAQYARIYGLSAIHNLKTLSDKELKRTFRTGVSKENTWWLSFNPIPATMITAVDANVDGRFVPYDFEQHGRHRILDDGITIPSAAALASLQRILPPTGPFDMAKALLICQDPAEAPYAVIRSARLDPMQLPRLMIEGDEVANPCPDAQLAAQLLRWRDEHRAELLVCWRQAVDRYFVFYPSAQTT